ncbi:NADase-type glycan-binding domain-containing protein [Salinibacterium sp. PAMC 21357]|uniref:NADase-type glycan-binding domain-containing protein n=1 Tax=Salinibacterium sp. PAMC 21357 TaxID=1112215 RepID=UPI0002886B16|nr:hypothetical protein [Salinibacterium sp. PAMC 21357]
MVQETPKAIIAVTARTHVAAVWHELWKAGLTIGLASAASVLITPTIQSILTEPSCDDPGDLRLVSRSELTAEASSVNGEEAGATYEASRAIDGDSSTSWVEGKLDSDENKYGEGEYLTITLAEPRNVQLVCVINGFARTQELYLHNSRVRQFSVVTDAGTTDSVLPEKPLELYAGYQSLNIAKGLTASIRLTIGTARAGQDSQQESDTSISEVEIWATNN